MAFIDIQSYLTQDFSIIEKKSYMDYINGDKNATDWITKADNRRDTILSLDLRCPHQYGPKQCTGWIGVNEKGVCKCNIQINSGHLCNDYVLDKIKKIS